MHAFLLTAALLSSNSDAPTILKAIDSICGDTWCEGDFGFHFQNVVLDASTNSTTVFFTIGINDPVDITQIQPIQFQASCTVAGYSTFTTIMQSDDSLTQEFYARLTECIQDVEDKLSKF
ncbi:MAG TPA: hypothetical protein VE954_19475 [Oligoflexus sp.]|uniref:hypothetical protein n=1 Tax=Oligoflexus sp. TaxID=1971216 RepID=UPI002D3DD0C7|nr:hypothetical protein [Oligoflexus sp.]HYX35283.1 hypothetical protein [Oligoflexus sp.]